MRKFKVIVTTQQGVIEEVVSSSCSALCVSVAANKYWDQGIKKIDVSPV